MKNFSVIVLLLTGIRENRNFGSFIHRIAWSTAITLVILMPHLCAEPQTIAAAAETEVDHEVAGLIEQIDSDDKQQRAEAIVALGALREKAGPAAKLLVEQLAETKGMMVMLIFGESTCSWPHSKTTSPRSAVWRPSNWGEFRLRP